MLVMLQQSYDEFSREAARTVASAVRKEPSLTLGLATGHTMIGVYQELVRMHQREGLDFSGVVTFNLEEYVGIPPNHPQSFPTMGSAGFSGLDGNTHRHDSGVSTASV